MEPARGNDSEEYPLGRRLLLHGFGVEELAAVAALACLPPLLGADEPGQEPPDLLLLAAAAALLILLRGLPFRPAGLLLPAGPRSRLLPKSRGGHERLREGGDVGEGGARDDDVDRAGVRRERVVVGRRRGGLPGGVRGRGRRGGGGARGGGRRGRGGEVREAVAEAVGADALGHPVLRVPLAPVLPLRSPHRRRSLASLDSSAAVLFSARVFSYCCT